jgi:hypothetical protein
MKWLPTLPVLGGLIFLSSCSSHELSRQKAFELIKQAHHYPVVWDFEVFTADPDQAVKLLAAGLETNGYIVVKHTQRMMDEGKPIVTLTDKSTEFLLPAEATDKDYKIQRVRVGELDMVEVTGVKMLGKGKKAVAEYTTQFRKLTPFAVLRGLTPDKVNTEKAYFSLYDDGWHVEKKPDLDFFTE